MTKHDGDCTFYDSMHNGFITDGICTCGYGRMYMRKNKFDFSELLSKERLMSLDMSQPHSKTVEDITRHFGIIEEAPLTFFDEKTGESI